MSSLFERLGGAPAVDAAVEVFYQKMLSDDRVKHFFTHTDMNRQRDHQKRFLTVAFGGPNQYNGQAMRAAHARLVNEQGLNDSHFDATLENLAASLRELGVAEALIAEAAQVAESTRNEVLNR